MNCSHSADFLGVLFGVCSGICLIYAILRRRGERFENVGCNCDSPIHLRPHAEFGLLTSCHETPLQATGI